MRGDSVARQLRIEPGAGWPNTLKKSAFLVCGLLFRAIRPPGPRSPFLLNFAIHMLDLVPFLFGEVAEVFAFSRGLDAFAVGLRFSNGAVGSLNLNYGRSFSAPTEEVELTIHNYSSWRISKDGQPTEWHEPPTFTSAGYCGLDTGHLSEIQEFVAALREGRQTRSAIYESCKSMVVYKAVAASAESGQMAELVYENA